jgi:hypothetical protein
MISRQARRQDMKHAWSRRERKRIETLGRRCKKKASRTTRKLWVDKMNTDVKGTGCEGEQWLRIGSEAGSLNT